LRPADPEQIEAWQPPPPWQRVGAPAGWIFRFFTGLTGIRNRTGTRMKLSPEVKIGGVLAPLFALRTEDDLGVGNVEGLRQFVDWAAGYGLRLVQILPINETGADNSPYNAISSVALEPTTLDCRPSTLEDLPP